MTRALVSLLVLMLTLAMPAQAADVVYPPGSRIGLAPPPGLESSDRFQGFIDADNDVLLLLVPMPAQAYSEIEKVMTIPALKKQRLTVEQRENVTLPNGGKAILVRGRQQAEGTKYRKWILVTSDPSLTALVTVQVPDKAKQMYSDAAIRSALTSVAIRQTVPTEELLGLLPFTVGDLAGFRVTRVLAGSVMLTEGPKDDIDAVDQPHLVIGASPGGPDQVGDRAAFARNALAGLPNVRDMRITNAEPMRLGGQQGYEIRADAKPAQGETELAMIQWMRFGSGGFLRIVGFASKDKWEEAFPRFRAVRDSVEPR
jgi:hypothetical protein